MESPTSAHQSRKRKLAEAASGPGWGAKSFSAAKINAFKDSGKDSGFGDFGRYFSEKQRKLRDQFQNEASNPILRDSDARSGKGETSSNSDKLIFRGVSIFVDGFTTPTHQELRFIMMNNGGCFENYFSRQRVTHIICSTLPDSKITNPRLLSRGLPIVKPEWIVDSLTAKRLLPWGSYQLERLAYSHPNQQTLDASFTALRDGSGSSLTKADQPSPLWSENKNHSNIREDLACVHGAKLHSATNVLGSSDERRSVDGANLLQERSLDPSMSEITNPSTCLDPVPPTTSHILPGKCPNELQPKTTREDLSNKGLTSTVMRQNQIEPKLAIADVDGRQRHSSLTDIDFVQNFFKYSRLHFIGTWRNRYLSLAGTFGKHGEGESQDRQLVLASSSRTPTIIHIDMDCFFVSVVVRGRPELVGKPVAVCHSDSEKGTGEISSANYPARSYGIKAGMFVREAKARCPDLTILPYDFAGYEEVADKVYHILHYHCSKVQALSCDEAFLDVTGHPDPIDLASRIREEIFSTTRCTASAGIAENLLLARLATKKAKPNGQYSIKSHEAKTFVAGLPVDELPGVGWALQEKLHLHGLYTCAQVQSVSKEALQKDFGVKTGSMLWSFAHGIDEREVQPAQERKSIGAEVNWGVRFSCMDDAQQFLVTLSKEVAGRLQSAGSCGRTITLKIKRRKEGSGEPVKYLGCGVCDNLSRSETIGYSTSSADVLLRIGRQLFTSLHVEPPDIRGMGLQVSRLESSNAGNQKQPQGLESWLAPSSKMPAMKETITLYPNKVQVQNAAESEEKIQHTGGVASPCHSKETKGGLLEVFDEEKHRNNNPPTPPVPPGVERQGVGGRLHRKVNPKDKPKRNNSVELPPLSQLDHSVLESLPPDILAELNLAYAKQIPKLSSLAGSSKTSPLVHVSIHQGVKSESHTRSTVEPASSPSTIPAPSSNSKPQKHDCENSDCRSMSPQPHAVSSGVSDPMNRPDFLQHSFLQHVREAVSSANSSCSLSSKLLSSSYYLPFHANASTRGLEKVIQQSVELLTQYIRAVASQNLEEVFLVLQYLKRLGGGCHLWRAVEEAASPGAKDLISELYGGRLAP